jgi:DNA-directed RNA polymerase specialized sigma24 family protein
MSSNQNNIGNDDVRPSPTGAAANVDITVPSTASLLDAAATTPANENGEARAGNDNATRRGTRDTTSLAAHKEVVRYIRGTLRRYGVAAHDMADAIAEVQTESIEAARARRMPASAAEWKAFAARVAVCWAIDRLREAKAREAYNTGPCEDPDAYSEPMLWAEGRDPVDTKRYLAILKDLFDSGQMPADGAEILWGEAEGVPHAEIAAELGVSETVVDNRLFRMRATFHARLAALGMLTVMLLLLGVLFAPRNDVAAPASSPPPPMESVPEERCPPGWDAGTPISTDASKTVRGKCVLSD